MLLENIYDKSVHQIKKVKYTVLGYGNTKTKVDKYRQSNYHIIIEPNNNGFDKYLIQEIVQEEYTKKTNVKYFLKQEKNLKMILIDYDNLSYYAQASLRRTMEKYVNNCKFILINHQLSKVIEPIRSRCLCIRVPLPSETVFETLFKIASKEILI